MNRFFIATVLCLHFTTNVACAGDKPSETFLELATGHGADHNLQELPGKLLSGSIDWDETRYVGVYAGKRFSRLGEAFPVFKNTPLRNVRHGFTLTMLKHSGLQDNLEAAAAYTLTTPPVRLGFVATDLSVGAGLSYAFSRPAYEDGPLDAPERRYRGQFYLLIENEWLLPKHEQWRLVFRVHHRSGVYGVIAPRNVGSNVLGMGIRRFF